MAVFKNPGGYNASSKVLEIKQIGCSGPYGDMAVVKYKDISGNWRAIVIDGGYMPEKSRLLAIKEPIDGIILTHWHRDHYEGIKTSGINSFKLYYGFKKGVARTKKAMIKDLEASDALYPDDSDVLVSTNLTTAISLFGGKQLSLNIIPPDLDPMDYDDENPFSLTTVFKLGDFSYFSLGDITKETFPDYLTTLSWNDSVIKLPHHGSKENNIGNSTLWGLLRTDNYFIISGYKANYMNETVSALIASNAQVSLIVAENQATDCSSVIRTSYPSWAKDGYFKLGTHVLIEVDGNGNYLISGDSKKPGDMYGGWSDC